MKIVRNIIILFLGAIFISCLPAEAPLDPDPAGLDQLTAADQRLLGADMAGMFGQSIRNGIYCADAINARVLSEYAFNRNWQPDDYIILGEEPDLNNYEPPYGFEGPMSGPDNSDGWYRIRNRSELESIERYTWIKWTPDIWDGSIEELTGFQRIDEDNFDDVNVEELGENLVILGYELRSGIVNGSIIQRTDFTPDIPVEGRDYLTASGSVTYQVSVDIRIPRPDEDRYTRLNTDASFRCQAVFPTAELNRANAETDTMYLTATQYELAYSSGLVNERGERVRRYSSAADGTGRGQFWNIVSEMGDDREAAMLEGNATVDVGIDAEAIRIEYYSPETGYYTLLSEDFDSLHDFDFEQ